jgi:hypothetical protein
MAGRNFTARGAAVRIGVACAAVCAAASPAAATVVTSIKIQNAIPTWLQVSEVIATQAGTGNDVALATAGATATATSVYTAGDVANYAIDGVGPAPYGQIYHSGSSDGSDYLLITLGQAYDLSGLTIDGRADGYGTARDDYSYQLFDGTTLVGSGTIDARNDAHSGSVTLDVATGAVPEPASWAMFLGGFGVIGGALRRRQQATVRFA